MAWPVPLQERQPEVLNETPGAIAILPKPFRVLLPLLIKLVALISTYLSNAILLSSGNFLSQSFSGSLYYRARIREGEYINEMTMLFAIDRSSVTIGKLAAFCKETKANLNRIGLLLLQVDLEIDIDESACPEDRELRDWADDEAAKYLGTILGRHPEVVSAMIPGSVYCENIDDVKSFSA